MTEKTKHRILSFVKKLINYEEPLPYHNMPTTEIKPIILKDRIPHNISFHNSFEESIALHNAYIEEIKLRLCRGLKKYITRVDHMHPEHGYTELIFEFYIKPKD